MKRKTGNGTVNRQYLYVLANFPFLWVVKVGISGDWRTRWNQIDKSAPGYDFPVFVLRFWGAYQVEQWIHRVCAPLRVRFWGSGKTERFWLPVGLFAAVVAVVVFLIQWIFLIALLLAVVWIVAGAPELAI